MSKNLIVKLFPVLTTFARAVAVSSLSAADAGEAGESRGSGGGARATARYRRGTEEAAHPEQDDQEDHLSLCVLNSRAREGIDAPAVTVEVHLSGGLPALSIVGLPEMAVKE